MKRVKDIMTKDVVCCHADMNLAAVVALMWEYNCGLLPVLDGREKLISVITDRDICIALATKGRPAAEITVDEVIKARYSDKVYACTPEDAISEALHVMKSTGLRRLPVIRGDHKLQGVITINDILTRVPAIEKEGYCEISDREIVEAMRAICDKVQAKAVGTH